MAVYELWSKEVPLEVITTRKIWYSLIYVYSVLSSGL